MRVWWSSVLLSERASRNEYKQHMNRVVMAKTDPRELGEALLEAQRHAHSLPGDHRMHTQMIHALHHHSRTNPSLLRQALHHIARPSRFHDEHHEHVLNILERTPMPDAIHLIGKYAEAGNMNAYHAAHGWMMRHPYMTAHFHTFVLPHLRHEVRHGRNWSWHPYLRFLESEADRYKREHPHLEHPYDYYKPSPFPLETQPEK